MQIKLEQLEHYLDNGLKPVYLICGEEPFLLQEASTLIRSKAREHGYSEHKLFQAEDLDFQHLSSGIETMSLFADKTMYEYRLDKLPLAAASKQIEQWCNEYNSDDLLIISCPRIDKRGKQKSWFKAIGNLGLTIDVFSVDSRAFPGWIKQRGMGFGMNLPPDVVSILCQRTEGNLLAAHQELHRLSLLANSDNEIDAATLEEFTADNAQFGQFELIDTCLRGESARLVRMLHVLREEGTNIMEITAPLNAEIRKLCRIAWERDEGNSLTKVYTQYRVWRAKQMVYNKALSRYPLKIWQQILSRLLMVDKAIKGQSNRDAWLTLESLLLVMSGQKRFSKFVTDNS